MQTMQEWKDHYRFTEEDAQLLQSLQPLAQGSKELLAAEFYDYLLGIPQTAALIRNEQHLDTLKITHQEWFATLFSGNYDNAYFHTLQRIGQAHVRAGLKSHFVNAAMNQVRQFCLTMIAENYHDQEDRRRLRNAVMKIIDINLDIMSSSYQEEELKKVFLWRGLETRLIGAAERFTYGLNLILVLALMGVSMSVVGLFLWDISHIFLGDMEKGILGALGTLLIIWMMIELMDNEIKNLKGGKFNILVFIGVIMVALIREILISTLRHDKLETQVFLAGTLMVLGIVYYLVAKSQQLHPSS